MRPLFFFGGVLWDYLTLRVHHVLDNLYLVGCFLLLLSVLVLDGRRAAGRTLPAWLWHRAHWLPAISQFLLGALLSALGVILVQVVHPGRGTLIVGLVAALAIATEVGFGGARGRFARWAVVGAMCFQLVSSVTPVFTGVLVHPGIAAVVAAAAVGGLAIAARWPTPGEAFHPRSLVVPIVCGLSGLGGMLGLVHADVVPPLPLVLEDAQVARGVERVAGGYLLDRPQQAVGLGVILHGAPEVTWSPGEPVSLFTTLAAPPSMRLEVVHRWTWWDPATLRWATSDRIEVDVVGGGIWRTWTTKRNLRPGDWRVHVETRDGRALGLVDLTIVEATADPG